ncbi:MAG: hypothetical protein AAFX95_23210 [Cyanobacteria bacterium J06639_16]
MEFLYCFANASLTQRILFYLLTTLRTNQRAIARSPVDCATVIFLNDRWILRLKLDPALGREPYDDCWAVLNENGFPYSPSPIMTLVFNDLDAGCNPTSVMNRYHIAIVSHGMPNPEDVQCFQEQFVTGLGYRPPSLV